MTTTTLPRRSLQSWFRRGLDSNPDGTALRVGARQLTYRELDERARRVAGAIVAAAGPRPARVGVLTARGEDGYVGILGAFYTGATVVPLNPEYPADRTRRMIAAAELSALVVDETGHGLVPGLRDEIGSAPVVVAGGGPVGA